MTEIHHPSKIAAKEETWNSVAEKYTLEISGFERALASEIASLLEVLNISPGSTLLEVGCGSGHLSLLLNLNGYKTDLLDFAEKALTHAAEAYKRFDGSPDTKFFNLDAINFTPDAVSNYTVAWNCGVCEHFSAESLVSMLHNMAAVSEKVLVIIPNPSSVFYIAGKRRLLNDGAWQYGTELQRDNYEQAFSMAGLNVLHHGYMGRDMTRNWITNAVGESGEHLFHTLLNEGQIPQDQYYLQYFLAEKGNRRVKTLRIDDNPTIDRTFYLDAMGTATALISTLKEQIYYLKLQIESQQSIIASDQSAKDEYTFVLAEKDSIISSKDAYIDSLKIDVTRKEAELSHNLELIQTLERTMADTTATLFEIQQSTWWRLTNPIRRVSSLFRPQR
ncbi:class I SAM-dependent methyltransferase [Brucella intermedia]|uniref:class I SAM-dependent methyltransferase n=1 Tax=Brucella intermedia TaxID=94625 RepID=UPI00046AFD6C|nr:methyltransferase domain-containing protein [Brucella intermedia]